MNTKLDSISGYVKKRALIIVIMAVVIFTAVIGVTYALNGNGLTRNGNGSGDRYSVQLVENSAEIGGWTAGMGPIDKKVYVTNTGHVSDDAGDVYVRIQLKEYMETGTVVYKQTPHRYVIGADGYYVVFPDEPSVMAATGAGGAWPGHSYEWLTDVATNTTGYFIRSQAHDPNGQYGRHVVTEYNIDEANSTPVIPGSVRAPKADRDNLPGPTNGECAYPLHRWEEANRLPTADYVVWILGANARALSDWMAAPASGAFWVYDNVNGTGWVYWMRPLAPETSTSNFLEQLDLINQPTTLGGDMIPFYYTVHTDMQAVSKDELDKTAVWSEMPQAVRDILRNS